MVKKDYGSQAGQAVVLVTHRTPCEQAPADVVLAIEGA